MRTCDFLRDGKQARCRSIDRSGSADQISGCSILLRGTTTRFTFGARQQTICPSGRRTGPRIIFASTAMACCQTFIKSRQRRNGRKSCCSKSSDIKIGLQLVKRWTLFPLSDREDPKTGQDLVGASAGRRSQADAAFCTRSSMKTTAHFSPDMRWIAYVSDESGSNEIYVRAISPASSAKRQVAGITEGAGPDRDGDGMAKSCTIVAPDGKLMAVEITAGQRRSSAERPKPLFQAPRVRHSSSIAMQYDALPTASDFCWRHLPQEASPSPFTVILNWTCSD